MHLNWILATEQEYTDAGYTPSPSERRWTIDTPNGKVEVILTHIQSVLEMADYESFVRKMPVGNYLSNESLQYVLPNEEVGYDT